ncbi:MAG: phosphatidate cytidylyltransferase [Thermodesulfovibrio sp.]|nr:phosphatidate cytidylyltransferase [Thermodesulfovibrio sp.]
MNLQGHKKRVLIAAIALPILVLFIVKLPPYFFLGLLAVVNIVGMWEFMKMYKTPSRWNILGVIFSLIIFLLNCLNPQNAIHYYAIIFMAVTVIRLLSKKSPYMALSDISPLIVGLLYIPTLVSFQWFLRDYGWQWILYLYGVVWTADSFAYYIGKGFGNRKLYPEVSPKKTWAGAYGSLLGGGIASVILGYFLLNKALLNLAIMGVLIGFVSIFGDLVESMFKRDAGVKDSSFLFPEHGGILDKIDAILFAGVLVYFGVRFI